MPGLFAAIADIRRMLYLIAAFTFKAGAYAVAFVAGAAFRIADNQLVTGVCLFAAIPMDTEVIGVVEASSVPGIDPSVTKDFLRYGCRVLTEITGYIREWYIGIQRILNIYPVIDGQMFMISRY